VTLILAVETATPRCAVALGHEGAVLASWSADGDRRHVETLAPAIAEACRTAGVGLGDLDALAVDIGPGLFTGMRVGIATVQGLALALGLPVHPVLSLDVLAHPCRASAVPVVAVVDARRGEVFHSRHLSGSAPTPAACGTPEAVAAGLAGLGPCLAVGDGADRYRGLFEAAGAEVIAALPTAEAALELALADRAAGSPGLDAAGLHARYLRTPDAKANFRVLVPRPTAAKAAAPAAQAGA
jgi:tRNA threonylcarbamoyladenosine biosynthesis protein TsaB